MTPVYIVKANGEKEPFLSEKLKHSLTKSGASEELAASIVKEVGRTIKDGMRTTDIYKHAFDHLRSKQASAARRYSLRRAVMDLGPSGFPFEDFVAHIFRRKGFETKTREMAMGQCVAHEVDIVAWNAEKLIMAESKFHNQLGVKSDLKVALYVKARMDDLENMVFPYGQDRQVNEGWLITNTKFTSTAIHYAECKNLILVGWNYPHVGNLQDMILETKVHPITCLMSLNGSQKQALLSRGIVLCQSLGDEPKHLDDLGLSGQKQNVVLNEVAEL